MPFDPTRLIVILIALSSLLLWVSGPIWVWRACRPVQSKRYPMVFAVVIVWTLSAIWAPIHFRFTAPEAPHPGTFGDIGKAVAFVVWGLYLLPSLASSATLAIARFKPRKPSGGGESPVLSNAET